MKISNIDISYLELLIQEAKNKKIVLWGAGNQIENFIDKYCGPEKLLPSPNYILETFQKTDRKFIRDIPIIDSINDFKLTPDNSLIIITAGLMELQGRVVSQEFYYYPMVHRRSIEAFDYLRKNSDACDESISLLADLRSKYIYRKVFENILNGILWDQKLYSPSPYFGNDLIGRLSNDGVFIFAGAFNGKHIVRARINNPDCSILAMEPSKHWFGFIQKQFSTDANLEIGNALFWNETTELGYYEDKKNNGLGASIVHDRSQADYLLNTTTIDDALNNRRASQIALDIEGAEQKALLGARNTIKRDKPNLCICLYHSLDDYFRIPQIVNDYGGYKLYIKQHSTLCPIETVLYATKTS